MWLDGTGTSQFIGSISASTVGIYNGAGSWSFVTTSAGNVGIGTMTPGEALEVNGGVRLNPKVPKPACTAAHRGTFWLTQGEAGIQDEVEVCAKTAADTYVWRRIS